MRKKMFFCENLLSSPRMSSWKTKDEEFQSQKHFPILALLLKHFSEKKVKISVPNWKFQQFRYCIFSLSLSLSQLCHSQKMCHFTINACCCFSLSTAGYILGIADLIFHVVRFVYFQEFQFHTDYRLVIECKFNFFILKKRRKEKHGHRSVMCCLST